MALKPLNRIRLASYLFPPAGLIVLWRTHDLHIGRKIAGTAGILLYSIIYAVAMVLLFMRFGGLEMEWRGGFPPVLTFNKTVPNYAAVEQDRASKHKQKAITPTATTNSTVYWTGFRGPNRNGIYTQKSVLTNWPAEGLKPLWKQPCGSGYASFCIANGLAVTIEQRREKEAIVAYDENTGSEVWKFDYNAQFDEPLGGEGPRATPSYDNGNIYSLGAMGDLFCLNAQTGNLIWQTQILRDNQADLLTYGMAGSPLIVDDKLIVCAGGTNGKSVVAYNKTNGAAVWKSLNDPAAYCAPMLVELAGQRQLLIMTGERAVGLIPETGELLWSFPWTVNQFNRQIAQPVLLGTNRFMISAGYGTGCVAVEVQKTGDKFTAEQAWRNKNLKNKFTSSIFWQGHIYGLDEDILTCLDAETGARKWKDGRYGYGQIVLASGHLIVLCGDGQLALVKTNPEQHEELARFQAITGKTWNHPAISDGKLFIRNLVEMACFDISVK